MKEDIKLNNKRLSELSRLKINMLILSLPDILAIKKIHNK